MTGSDAIDAAYRSHRDGLRRYALSMTHDPDVADELVQEAFLRLAIELARGVTPIEPAAWLTRVVANLGRSWGRRVTAAQRVRPMARSEGPTVGPDEIAVRRERVAALEHALSTLPRPHRAAVVMAAHGYRGSEIAEHLGRSVPATRILLFRARQRMRSDSDVAGYGTA